MSGYSDLSKEEKVNVIGGIVAIGTLIIGFVAFNEFVLTPSQIDRIWESGVTFIGVVRSILPGFYVMVVLPTLIVVSITVAILKRHLSGLATGLLALLAVGGALLSSYLLLSLFDLFSAVLPLEAQAILMLLAFFVPSIIIALIMKTPKANNYIRKAFGQQMREQV